MDQTEMNRFKGPWSPEEDVLLRRLVQHHGSRNWSLISMSIPDRSGKSSRLRWCNQVSPQVEHQAFTPEKDKIIIPARARFCNEWATIARLLNGWTVKNHRSSTLKRKYMGNPGSPSGSDASDSSAAVLSSSHNTNNVLYRPVARTGAVGVVPPTLVAEGTALPSEGERDRNDPSTLVLPVHQHRGPDVPCYLVFEFIEFCSNFIICLLTNGLDFIFPSSSEASLEI